MQPSQCSIEECPNPPLAHGLCLQHTKIRFEHHHPMSGSKNGGRVIMAGTFFNSLSTKQSDGVENLEQVLPVVRVPFIRDETTFKYYNYKGRKDATSFIYKPPDSLNLRQELVEGIANENFLEKPVVFLVATNIPHTSIYILYQGQFYSVAFGYDSTPDVGSLYSIDIPLIQFSEARIVWIGILTEAIMQRLQGEFNQVTHIVGNFEVGKQFVVDRLMFFHVPRVYGGIGADTDPTQWNCTKWAMQILFGSQIPANFRELVSKTNPGLREDQLTRWLNAYREHDPDAYMRMLNEINDQSFPRVSIGGRRKRMTNNINRNRIKKKSGKMRRTIRKRTRKT